MRRRKYDVSVDGYRIRNEADFDRVDMSRAERRWKHRKAKLEKRGLSWRVLVMGYRLFRRTISEADLEREGMCKEEPERWCTESCRKFMRRECAGMRYVKVGESRWRDQRDPRSRALNDPPSLYEEENPR